MRCLSLYKPAEFAMLAAEKMDEMGKLIEESMKSGVLVATGGFQPSPKDVRVRSSKGQVAISDGPFTEAKELIGGFALFEVKSREEAIEMAKRFLRIAGDGECEIHQLMDGP